MTGKNVKQQTPTQFFKCSQKEQIRGAANCEGLRHHSKHFYLKD